MADAEEEANHAPPPADAEWLYSEMEKRLRAMIVALMNPTVDRVTILTAEQTILREMCIEQGQQVGHLRGVQSKLTEAHATLRVFDDRMSKMDMHVHDTLIKSKEQEHIMRQQVEEMRTDLQQQKEHIETQDRVIEQAGLDIDRLQKALQASIEASEARQDTDRRQAHTQKCELEVQITNLALKHNELTDQLWGDETTLARVTGEMRRLSQMLEEVRASAEDLQETTMRRVDYEKIRREVDTQMNKVDFDLSAMGKMVGNTVNEIKEHLHTGLKAAGTHYSAFAAEVRASYSEEINVSRKLREDVDKAVAEMRRQLEIADNQRVETAMKSNELVEELRHDMEQLDRRRKTDRSAAELEFKGHKVRLAALSDNAELVLRVLDQLCALSSTLLESAQIQCALDEQDIADREHMYLMGLREEMAPANSGQQQLPPQLAAASHMSPGRSPPRKTGPGGWNRNRQPAISVDQRCMSCSGQARTVLSAFKVACLQYNPSSVVYEDRDHSRQELLQRVSQMLEVARGQLARVPVGPAAKVALGLTPVATAPAPHSARSATTAGAEMAPASLTANTDELKPNLKEYAVAAALTKVENSPRLPSLTKSHLPIKGRASFQQSAVLI